MLRHQLDRPVPPKRAIVLGAGFIGGRAADLMEQAGAATIRLGRRDLDLLAADASSRLTSVLRDGDVLVITSALAPCKTSTMLVQNARMIEAVCAALQRVAVGHVLYVSSDAVYRDSMEPLQEQSCAAPDSLHGAMHAARECMLKDAVAEKLAILRPTLVYGAADPHNSYGPNRFWRVAAEGRPVTLFGDGEERRDHVLVDDVAELIRHMVWQRSVGILNAVTGEVHSFRDVAELVVARFTPSPPVQATTRRGPIPHNGYRAFDPAATFAAFPDFRYTGLQQGLGRMQEQRAGTDRG
jgi:UDP-glucose 4-epimerase